VACVLTLTRQLGLSLLLVCLAMLCGALRQRLLHSEVFDEEGLHVVNSEVGTNVLLASCFVTCVLHAVHGCLWPLAGVSSTVSCSTSAAAQQVHGVLARARQQHTESMPAINMSRTVLLAPCRLAVCRLGSSDCPDACLPGPSSGAHNACLSQLILPCLLCVNRAWVTAASMQPLSTLDVCVVL
jgi:hypothetical protein